MVMTAEPDLTPTQMRVLRLLVQGASNAAIAGDLGISESAVEKQIDAIRERAGSERSAPRDRRWLVALAYRLGRDGCLEPSRNCG